MKLKNLLNKTVSNESMEKFMDRMDTILCYLVYITGALLLIVQLYNAHLKLLNI
jgi:uncharacterized membrane protein YiaA